MAVTLISFNSVQAVNPSHEFNLRYAPHMGMFKNHVGDDPIEQWNFIADQGFAAFEDNTMRKQEVALQEKMAKTMQNRGIKMGVFVAVFL